MRRIVLFLAATLAAVPWANARPSSTTAGLHESGATFGRDTLVAIASGVDVAATSIVAYEMASGKKALAATSVSVLLLGPSIAYTVTELRRNPGDVLLYGVTAWSSALLAKAVIDLVRFHDPSTRRSNERIIIQPTFQPNLDKPAIGLDVVGQF